MSEKEWKLESSVTATPCVSIGAQVFYFFLKPVSKTCLDLLRNKLGLHDIYALASRSVLLVFILTCNKKILLK